jgi:hypothetical protein
MDKIEATQTKRNDKFEDALEAALDNFGDFHTT